jgi:hypothetical protein
MRNLALLLIVVALLVVAGCAGESPSPTPLPSPVPTEAPATATADGSSEAEVPVESGPASCTEAPLDFPTLTGIHPVTEEDNIFGPADAPITFIEYADFQ